LLGEIHALGIDTSRDMEKLAYAKESIASDVLRIALLGAFSDGKTSVVAAWLGRLLEDMKIDMDESSDRLATYLPEGLPGKCEIVDTPGLFGDKELSTDGRRVMYEDVTKRFISEAHLVLYVVDATNPLKDSHADIVKWVLRDLQKLKSTIFVINKMDEVCDLRDEEAFNEQAGIKRENLKAKLIRAADLNEAEALQLNIVCAAANPSGRGLPFWFERLPDFHARSRIPTLKEAALATLDSSIPDVLRAKTGMDVARDVVAGKLVALEAHYSALVQGKVDTQQEIERLGDAISRGRREVLRHAAGLGDELDALDKELMGKLRPLEMKDLRAFLEDEIGLDEDVVGAKLQRRIKSIVDKYAEQSAEVTNQVGKEIARQIDNTRGLLGALGGHAKDLAGQGFKGLQKANPAAIKSAILLARDLLSQVGVVIKFKPWEVTKLAGNITKWAGPAGAVLQVGGDIYQHFKRAELEAALGSAKLSMGAEVQKATQQVRARLVSDPEIFAFLSPQLLQFEQVVALLQREMEKLDAGAGAVADLRERLGALGSAN
jgi:GTPase SAR1 family protein